MHSTHTASEERVAVAISTLFHDFLCHTYIFPDVPEGNGEVLSGVVHSLDVEQETLERVWQVKLQLDDGKHDRSKNNKIAND